MTGVLHVQTRAYPTLHERLPAVLPATVPVPGRPDLEPRLDDMCSLAYGIAPVVAIDLAPLPRPVDPDERWTVVDRRLRALWSGAVLVSYAIRHERDLEALDPLQLADLDAEVNRELRRQDGDDLRAVLEALSASAVILGVDWPGRPVPEDEHDDRAALPDPREVRYNCHLVGDRMAWERDLRIHTPADLAGRVTCRPLLPYTFAWTMDGRDDVDAVLDRLEGADVAVAQRSVLAAAGNDALRLLEHLADTPADGLGANRYRRYLDRIRACYHRLDTYRYDSSQEDRGIYLAAREEMDLDGIHDRTESLLQRVGESLGAAVAEQSKVLDDRLNRVAAVLTVAASGSFFFDTISFWRGAQITGPGARQVIVASVWTMVLFGLAGLLLWR
ncbi:MAG: hypothetical protein KDB10_22610, partial [Acidimicrobiales bacterium]|nr:hypothetical protein [Acidimicrobiales bacterium]